MTKVQFRYHEGRRIRRKPVLYRHFAADGELLYVGLSCNPMQRLATHAHGAEWFKLTARIELEHLAEGENPMQAERKAIFEGQPTYNVLLKDGKLWKKIADKTHEENQGRKKGKEE